MESQSLVSSEIILSIYSRGAQRGKVTCPESHSRPQIKARTQDSQPSAHPTTSHVPLPVSSVCTEISVSPSHLVLPESRGLRWGQASTDHSLSQASLPGQGVRMIPAASTLLGTAQTGGQGRGGETGGSPQAGGGLGGRGPVCLDLTQHLHLVLPRPHLQGKGSWRHHEAGRQK